MALGTNGSTLTAELNRLANGGTYPAIQSYVGDAQAANTWAGTTGLDLVGALNVKAGNTRPDYKDLRGVCNQLGSTTDLAPAAALRARNS
jgi:hypothetical protein